MRIGWLFVPLILLPAIFSGCLEDSPVLPTSVEVDFESEPSSNTILGEITTDVNIPDGTLDLVYEINNESVVCSKYHEKCKILSQYSGKTHTVEIQEGIGQCYDTCKVEVTIYYRGEKVGKFDSINF